MAFRLICMSMFLLEIQYHVEESLSTPDEVWTKLEVLFRIKEYCEECMQDIDKTKPTKIHQKNKLLSLKSTSTCPCMHLRSHMQRLMHILLFHTFEMMSHQSDQISDLISKSYSEYIEHADDEPDQRPKWAQSILPTIDYLTDDPQNQ
jgi:hypothetical protein